MVLEGDYLAKFGLYFVYYAQNCVVLAMKFQLGNAEDLKSIANKKR